MCNAVCTALRLLRGCVCVRRRTRMHAYARARTRIRSLQIARVIEAVTAKYGQLNTVVSCAGIVKMEAIVGPSGPHTLATFQKLLTVNTVGTFNVLRLAAESMAKGAADEHGERGVIVNTARYVCTNVIPCMGTHTCV
ncbi:MAG: SDR family NAD(P)-dependent oxidoreductase [Methanosarcinales archaeon]|nr:MAG: SDR family NAD(P)-dependent oxidoreductase [Methanosarcinales archaeon]